MEGVLCMLTEFCDSFSLMKRLYDQVMEPVCRNYGITRMELDILLFLANNPCYDTAADIIGRRQLTKSHVSSSVRRLEERGLLGRTFRQGNRKTVHLSLLAGSAPIVKEGRNAQKQYFSEIFKGFSKEEIQKIGGNFIRIAGNARQAIMED